MAISTRISRNPVTPSAQSPSTGARPSSSRPSSAKNSIAASRFSTTTPTLSMRLTVMSAPAPVVHGDRTAAERLRRDQLEPPRAGQPALVQGRAVAGDPGMDEQFVLVDHIQPVQLGRELAATEQYAVWGRVLELLYARAQVVGDVVAVGPREVLSRRGHHVLRFGLQL